MDKNDFLKIAEKQARVENYASAYSAAYLCRDDANAKTALLKALINASAIMAARARARYARVTIFGAFLASVLSGCMSLGAPDLDPTPLEAGRLPAPDITVQLPQLGPCTDAPERAFSLDSSKPVTVLVHGCKGSAGRFRSLAQLYAFHGQQAVCFSYDDRASLVHSSAQLAAAVDALAGRMRNRDITVIGHSMGGLVARKAMEGEHRTEWEANGVNVDLVTVSAPVSGIAAANPCGDRRLHWASIGTVPLICWAVTGDNWHEITASSDFIRRPGPLVASVRRYVKVVTDEREACRRRDAAGACLQSDYTFSLAEQYQPIIDGYPRLTNVEVASGHVEIVGYKGVAPRKLVSILQQQGLLAATAAGREDALEGLLSQLY